MARRTWDKIESVPEFTSAELRQLEVWDRQVLTLFVEILQNNRGHASPFEYFITGLVKSSASGLLTPDDVAFEVEQFRDLFAENLIDVRNFVDGYPQLFEKGEQQTERASERGERNDALKSTTNQPISEKVKSSSRPHPVYTKPPKGEPRPEVSA